MRKNALVKSLLTSDMFLENVHVPYKNFETLLHAQERY